MSILEIIVGVMLIACSAVITLLVLAQESKSGMGAVDGGMYVDMSSRSTDAKIAKVTSYAGVAFFALAVIVSAISLIAK